MSIIDKIKEQDAEPGMKEHLEESMQSGPEKGLKDGVGSSSF